MNESSHRWRNCLQVFDSENQKYWLIFMKTSFFAIKIITYTLITINQTKKTLKKIQKLSICLNQTFTINAAITFIQ